MSITFYTGAMMAHGKNYSDNHYPLHFLDVETSSLNPSTGEILQICIITDYGHDTEPHCWSTRIKPQRLADTGDERSLEINGYIKNEHLWRDAPTMEVMAEVIAEKLAIGTIVGHNVGFDMAFVRAELRRYTDKRIAYRKIDTQMLMMEHLPIPWTSLKSARIFFGWPTSRAHDAVYDAQDTLRLFYELWRCCPVKRGLWEEAWKKKQARKQSKR